MSDIVSREPLVQDTERLRTKLVRGVTLQQGVWLILVLATEHFCIRATYRGPVQRANTRGCGRGGREGGEGGGAGGQIQNASPYRLVSSYTLLLIYLFEVHA